MVDGVVRDHPFRFVVVLSARVQVSIETREVAARHVMSNTPAEYGRRIRCPPRRNFSYSSAEESPCRPARLHPHRSFNTALERRGRECVGSGICCASQAPNLSGLPLPRSKHQVALSRNRELSRLQASRHPRRLYAIRKRLRRRPTFAACFACRVLWPA